jgi:hypothetical protein
MVAVGAAVRTSEAGRRYLIAYNLIRADWSNYMIGVLYQPLPLALGGLTFIALFLGLRRTRLRSYYLLLPAATWFLAALDEWYMSTYQPQMNIRIDLLFFLALMVVATPLGILLVALHRRS